MGASVGLVLNNFRSYTSSQPMDDFHYFVVFILPFFILRFHLKGRCNPIAAANEAAFDLYWAFVDLILQPVSLSICVLNLPKLVTNVTVYLI